MKRIIDGVTYNTDTSTLLAKKDELTLYNNEERPSTAHLYQTRGGAFFVHELIDLGHDGYGESIEKDRAKALSEKQAQAWIMEGDVEVIHNPFDDPPEASAEAEPSATIYVRVPASLKHRLEQSAKAERLSGNAWAIRCIERCLSPNDRARTDLGLAWHLANSICENELKPGADVAMAKRIASIIESNWAGLGFLAGSRFDDDMSVMAFLNEWDTAFNEYIDDTK